MVGYNIWVTATATLVNYKSVEVVIKEEGLFCCSLQINWVELHVMVSKICFYLLNILGNFTLPQVFHQSHFYPKYSETFEFHDLLC